MSCDTSVSLLDYRSITLQLVLVFILPLTQRIHFICQSVAPPNDAILLSDEATKITCQIYNAYNCVLFFSLLFPSRFRYACRFCFFYLCSFYGRRRRDGHKAKSLMSPLRHNSMGQCADKCFLKQHTSISNSFMTCRTNYYNFAVSQAKFSTSHAS